MSTARLRNVLYLSIADVFIGASGVFLVLVVLATNVDDPPVPRFVDVEIRCEGTANNWQIAAAADAPPVDMETWFETFEGTTLLARVGLYTARDQLPCFRAFSNMARAHNIALTSRDADGVSVAPVFLPLLPEATE